MADDDFGGGLDFGGADATLPDNAGYTGGTGFDLSPSAGAEAPGGDAAMSSPPGSGFQFGGRVRAAYDNRPQLDSTNPMQDRLNAATSARQQLQRRIDNPVRAFLKPQAWQQDVENAGKIDQQLLETRKQMQAQQDLRQSAANAGLDPDRIARLGPTSSEQTVINEWTSQLNTGSFNAAKVFMGMGEAGQKVLAQQEGAYMPALAQRNTEAQTVIDQLNTAAQHSDKAYQDMVKTLQGQGVDIAKVVGNYVPGFAVPAKADAWLMRSKGAQGALGQAKQLVSQYDQRQAALGQSTAMTKEQNEVQLPTHFKGAYGDAIPGSAGVTLASGEIGAKMAPGSNDPAANYGKTYNNESAEGRKAFNDSLNTEQAKGAIADYKMVKKVNALLNDPQTFKSAAGIAVLTGELGAVERDLAEGSKAAGNVGLSRMLQDKYGHIGAARNFTAREWSEFASLIGGKPTDRMSDTTIKGIKDIVKFKFDQSANELHERIGQPLTIAGYQGMDLSHTGLDKDMQSDPTLRGQYEQGRQAYVNDVLKHPAVFEGTSRIMLREDSPNGTYKPGKQGAAVPGVQGTAQNGVTPPNPRNFTPDQTQTMTNMATMNIESGGGTGKQGPDAPGSKYRGLAQMSPSEMQKYGVTDPNDHNQVNMALSLKAIDDGKTLTRAGIENTPANRYLMHQQGPAGAPALLKADPDTPAWEAVRKYYGSDAVAKKAIWGNLPDSAKKEFGSVENVTASGFTGWWTDRYNRELAKVAKAVGGAAVGMVPGVGAAKLLYDSLPDSVKQKAKDAVVDNAPAIGSTAGSLIGGAAGTAASPGVGTVAGSVAGGAAGGAAGQAFKNWMQGRDISEDTGKEAALGGAFGIVPGGNAGRGARIAATAARVAGGGVVNAASKAGETDDAGEIAKAGIVGGGIAAAGEAGGALLSRVGQALGMAGHKIWSRFSPSAQQELTQAGEVIAKGKPEAPQPTAAGPVPASVKQAHQNAVAEYDAAVQTAKDAGLDPEHLGYAVSQVGNGAKAGEAAVTAPLERARKDLGQGFNEVSAAAGRAAPAATHGTPGAQKALADGPLSIVRSKDNPGGKIAEKFADKAADVEMQVTAPAKSWQAKWDQLHTVQSDLLAAERDAAQSTATGKSEEAKAMRALAETVHTQQAKIAKHVFGADGAKVVMEQYNHLRTQYAKLMDLEGGKGLIEKVSKGGKEGRDTLAQFDKFAGNDEFAKMMVRRLVHADKAGNSKITWPMVALAQTAHAVPGVGTAAATTVAVAKAQMAVRKWLTDRAAGKPAQLRDYFPKPANNNRPSPQLPAVGARAATQGAQ